MKKSELKKLVLFVLNEIYEHDSPYMESDDSALDNDTFDSEMKRALQGWKAHKSQTSGEDDSGYDLNDPKHPTYAERMADRADIARDEKKYAGLDESKEDKITTPIKDDIRNVKPKALSSASKESGPAKGTSGLKDSPEKEENTQMGKDDKSVTSTSSPKEKKETKKLPVKDNTSNTETDHFADQKTTPEPPANEKEESKIRPVGGHALKEEIMRMVHEAIEETGILNEGYSLKKVKEFAASNGMATIYEIVDNRSAEQIGLAQFFKSFLSIELNRTEKLIKINVGKNDPQAAFNYWIKTSPKAKKLGLTEMARTKGAVSIADRIPNPKSPTGYSHRITGEPVSAPKNTGKNYAAKGMSGMGRPTAESIDYIDVIAELPTGTKAIGEFPLNARTLSGAIDKSSLESRVSKFIHGNADLMEHSDSWPKGIDKNVFPTFKKIEELWLDDKLTLSNNRITLYIDPDYEMLRAK